MQSFSQVFNRCRCVTLPPEEPHCLDKSLFTVKCFGAGDFRDLSFSEVSDIVPIVPKSVKVFRNSCNGCRHLAVPSPGIARGRVFEEALWAGIFGVLQTSQKIFMNSLWMRIYRRIGSRIYEIKEALAHSVSTHAFVALHCESTTHTPPTSSKNKEVKL